MLKMYKGSPELLVNIAFPVVGSPSQSAASRHTKEKLVVFNQVQSTS